MAGIGQDTSGEKHEGLSAEFLGHIRNADALAIVVRCFENPQAPHPAGSLNADRNLDDLTSELLVTDLATVQKRIETTAHKAKSGDKKFSEEMEFLVQLRDHLNEGHPAIELRVSGPNEAVVRELFLLTMKPRFYVVNVNEDTLAPAAEMIESDKPASGASGEFACAAAVLERARAQGAGRGDYRRLGKTGGRAG